MSAATVIATRRLRQLSEGIPRPFWILLLGTFITKAGAFVVPLLFVYLTQSRGLPLTQAGAIVSLFGLGSLLGTVLGGALADRFGRRVTMLVSLVTGAGFMLVLGMVREPVLIAGSTFLLGLTGDAYRPASQALVADLVPAPYQLKAFAAQYWAINLGFTFASLIGGYMATRNFAALFVGDALTTLVLAVIVYRGIAETRPEPSGDRAKQGSLLTPFTDLVYLPFLLLNFLVVAVFFQHLSALPEDMRSKGLTTLDFGMAVAINGLLIVLLQPVVTARVDGISRAKLLAAAATFVGIGFGLTRLATSLPLYMLSVAVWTLGEIIMAPVSASVVADLSPAHLRGRYQGAFHVTWSLGAMVAPVVGPWIIEKTSLGTLWTSCLGVGLFAAFIHLTVTSRVLPHVGASPTTPE